MRAQIRLSGCDDETAFDLDVTDAEAVFLTRLVIESRAASECQCQPILSVTEAAE